MKTPTYEQVLDYWVKNRKVSIHMLDPEGHLSAFAIPEPHSDKFVREMQRVIDHAEVFQIDGRRPMSRQAFRETLKSSEAQVQERCA